MKYEIHFHEVYPIIEHDSKKYLIDTGAQISLSKDGNIKLGDINYLTPKENKGISPETISKFIGFEIDALIGATVLNKNKYELNYSKEEFNIGDDANNASVEVKNIAGIPSTVIEINGSQKRMFIDSGAKISYLNGIQFSPDDEEVEDFYPPNMIFKTQLSSLKVSDEMGDIEMKFGSLPNSISQMQDQYNVDGILGYEYLMKRVLSIKHWALTITH